MSRVTTEGSNLMPHYLVFGSSRTKDVTGERRDTGLTWWPNPIGVFRADTADDACMKAAQKSGRMATFAAVECHPWGVAIMDVDGAYELGNELEEADAKIKDTENRLKALERQNDDAYKKVTKDLDDLEKS